MLKSLFAPLKLSLFAFVCSFTSPALAQVTSDNTVNTQVNTNDNVAEITGGQTRGSNLFHSFQDFSVPTGNEAFFNNADSISNIFSRVTGGNISNIDGAIRANGSASLFLINPAGIIFGENASLNIGGSFYGSTASSILFEEGEFSAVDNLNQPILTVNAPIGLGFRDNPGDIINRSFALNGMGDNAGLEVSSGNTLALIGGNLDLEVGNVTARGGNIFLGGLSQAGTVNIAEDGSLSFSENLTLADITLTNFADVDAVGAGGGNINIDARNLSLAAGEFGSSSIAAGVIPESDNPEAQAGNIVINVAENISLNDSEILNQTQGAGNSGNITINSGSIELINGGRVDATTFGQGNAGDVNVTATEDIAIDGEDSDGSVSRITSLVDFDAEGDSGEVTISTANLNLTDGGRVDASTLNQGSAGEVNVTATGDITVDGEDSDGSPSGIISGVGSNATGNSGGVTVSTSNLNLTNGGIVLADTFGQGNAGAINITATGDIIIANRENSNSFASGITSLVSSDATGDSGEVTISTANLNLTNGGQVDASTFGRGNAGAVNITATGDITVDGEDSDGFSSSILSFIAENAEGNSGGVTIFTTNLNLTNGGFIDANTFGQGNAGDVEVNALESIFIDGVENARLGISANAVVNNGNGGNVNVSTDRLIIQNNGIIEATNRDFQLDLVGTGLPGNISIEANTIELNDGAIGAATQSTGEVRGNIDLNVAESITLRNNSFISAEAFGAANGGNLNIDTNFIVAFPDGNNDIVASAEQGNGGNININAESLFGIEERPLNDSTNDINASSEFSLDGNVSVSTIDVDPVQGAAELPTNIVVPEETTQQACASNREAAAKNGLDITGKGGVFPDPTLPLSSLNAIGEEEISSTSAIPQPIDTSKGKIQPARGVRVTKSGKVTLTAYRTNNAGERLPEIKRNCGQI